MKLGILIAIFVFNFCTYSFALGEKQVVEDIFKEAGYSHKVYGGVEILTDEINGMKWEWNSKRFLMDSFSSDGECRKKRSSLDRRYSGVKYQQYVVTHAMITDIVRQSGRHGFRLATIEEMRDLISRVETSVKKLAEENPDYESVFKKHLESVLTSPSGRINSLCSDSGDNTIYGENILGFSGGPHCECEGLILLVKN